MALIRREGRDKLLGRAKYIDDMTLPGMIHGTTVRSSIARGVIEKIHFDPGVPWDEFTIVTAKDIPGKNCVTHLIQDQPCLADTRINHPEEPVVLLAHPDRYLLEKARKLVRLEIKPEPGVFTIDDSLKCNPVIWGKDNTFKSILIEKGDVNSIWANADHVIEGEYTSGAQEQLYIEPNGMIAVASGDGITVWGSLQCPYYVHHALMETFALPAEKVRIVQVETGGGFGGKEDYPSVIAAHAALLALKSGKPVKIIYDRAEDMAATTKRHPAKVRHKTAVSRDGQLLAMDIEFYLDGGAYCTISPVVLSRGSIHAAGPYRCPNIRIRSRALATNAPPNGAFRGFGAPQSLFAMERHMDKVAHTLGIAPEELRRKNLLVQGDTTATGQTLREDPQLQALLAKALDATDFVAKQKEFEAFNHQPNNPYRRGIGLATFMHGGGFTGGGETFLKSIAAVEATAEGHVVVLASSTEMGQGSKTVFTKIVGDALGLPDTMIEVPYPDTSRVPNSGPTVASRTTMIVGKIVEGAALSLRKILQDAKFLKDRYTPEEFAKACQAYLAKEGPLKAFSQYQKPPHIQWDDATYRGDAYGAFAWAVYIAEVTVDLRTFETKVDRFTATQEIGKVMHPTLASGQIEGGVMQGIGYALYEEVQLKEGRMSNNRMTNYIIPTAKDAPEIKVIFAENPYAHGAQGSKGIGELPLDGTAPAILNAVEMATGARPTQIPLLPEVLMRVMPVDKTGGAT